jgi:hypothetical protein
VRPFDVAKNDSGKGSFSPICYTVKVSGFAPEHPRGRDYAGAGNSRQLLATSGAYLRVFSFLECYMAGRGRASFQKRQKEQVRLERRQQKAARKQERRVQKESGIVMDDDNVMDLDLDTDMDLDFDTADGDEGEEGEGNEDARPAAE